ncbi:MAG: biotin--[Firmicutes bacterium]|nr:biotin--[acetyl-CoA-carboxylase] ligase [Bacillota bacterium]
ILADHQTAGRGRRGRSFFSPEGGFYYTYVFRPEPTTTGQSASQPEPATTGPSAPQPPTADPSAPQPPTSGQSAPQPPTTGQSAPQLTTAGPSAPQLPTTSPSASQPPTTNQSAADPTALVTIAAAVAAAEAVQIYTGIDVRIKWVNDLLLDQRKVGGILCEAVRLPSGTLNGIIIGIGINCLPQEFPAELAEIAGTLGLKEIDRSALAAVLTERLQFWLASPFQSTLIDRYRALCSTLGRRVSFLRNGETVIGIAEDVNELGNLLVRAGSDLFTLNSGEISLLKW